MNPEVIYQPSDWGTEFHRLPHDEALGAGSAGPGKSLVLLMEPLEQIQTEHKRCVNKNHPFHIPWGSSTGWALHLRRTRPMLEHSLVRAKRMFPRIDPKVRYDADRYTFLFASGYRYQFGHCKDKDDWEQYLSAEFSIILYDELVQFLEEQYDQINTRLRSPDPVLSKMLKIRAMSNPLMTQGDDSSSFTIKNPFWVRDRFVKPARNGRVTFKRKLVDSATGEVLKWYKWIYLPATIDDNPDKAFVKQYKAQLLNAPRHIRQALLYGDWWLTVGAYFGEVWNESLNVCAPFRVPTDWPWFRSMDWGFKKPGCVHWWAMDDDDNLFCVKEYTFKNQTDEMVAERIKEIEEGLGLWDKVAKRSRITGPADTQLWERRGDSGKTKAEVFADVGVSWVPARKAGKDSAGRAHGRAANALRIYKRLGDSDRGTTTPGLVLFSSCSKLIETLPGVQQTPGDPDTPMDSKYDHWFDSACYAVGYASRGRCGIGLPSREKDEWEDDDDVKPRLERGLSGYGI